MDIIPEVFIMKRYETPEVKVSAPITSEDILLGSDVIIDAKDLFEE